jgi:peptide-methionine (S)-S-oxide reductase
VESGYSGGQLANPSYKQVCTGTTGHAESVRITFDPDIISYADILRVLFTIHDPTTKDRQGGDVGPQYRSVIFYHSPEQKRTAEEIIKEAQSHWDAPIVTELVPAVPFYQAEDYHQEYFERNGSQPYCQMVVAPKVAKFRKTYFDRLKA